MLDHNKAQASLVIGGGFAGAIGAAAALVKAILILCAGIVIAGVTYYTASGYAYDACKSASPISAVSKPEVHGTGTGYFLHYHPMLTRNKPGKGHCFYVR